MVFSDGRPVVHQASGTSLLSNTSNTTSISTRAILWSDKESAVGKSKSR